MIPIFLISLSRQQQKREISLQRFKDVGINNITWWRAVDGKNEELTLFPIDRSRVQRYRLFGCIFCSFNRVYSDTEYACSFSHMSIYKHMVENDIDYALIVEDDVYLDQKIAKLIENADIVMKKHDMDILFIDYEDKLRSFSNQTFTESGINIKRIGVPGFDWIFNRRKLVYLTSGYILSKKAARILMEKGLPIRMTADMLTGLLSYTKLKAYRTEEKHLTNAGYETDILHFFHMPENDRKGLRLLALKFKLFFKRISGKL